MLWLAGPDNQRQPKFPQCTPIAVNPPLSIQLCAPQRPPCKIIIDDRHHIRDSEAGALKQWPQRNPWGRGAIAFARIWCSLGSVITSFNRSPLPMPDRPRAGGVRSYGLAGEAAARGRVGAVGRRSSGDVAGWVEPRESARQRCGDLGGEQERRPPNGCPAARWKQSIGASAWSWPSRPRRLPAAFSDRHLLRCRFRPFQGSRLPCWT